MTTMNTLFTLGNKRSGTTLLGRLLNLHPEIFISHESDIAWILYQSRHGMPEKYKCYQWDGPAGLIASLNAVAPTRWFEKGREPGQSVLRKAFFEMQQHLMVHGSSVQTPSGKKAVSWIGDKKPVQNCDPEIAQFIHSLFPDARYFHIVRHPGPVLSSMQAAARSWSVVPEYWRAGEAAILDRWAIHEEQAIAMKQWLGNSILSSRYEDLLANPIQQMQRCFQHLQLDDSDAIRQQITNIVNTGNLLNTVGIQAQFHTGRVAEMMDRYGYRVDGSVA